MISFKARTEFPQGYFCHTSPKLSKCPSRQSHSRSGVKNVLDEFHLRLEAEDEAHQVPRSSSSAMRAEQSSTTKADPKKPGGSGSLSQGDRARRPENCELRIRIQPTTFQQIQGPDLDFWLGIGRAILPEGCRHSHVTDSGMNASRTWKLSSNSFIFTANDKVQQAATKQCKTVQREWEFCASVCRDCLDLRMLWNEEQLSEVVSEGSISQTRQLAAKTIVVEEEVELVFNWFIRKRCWRATGINEKVPQQFYLFATPRTTSQVLLLIDTGDYNAITRGINILQQAHAHLCDSSSHILHTHNASGSSPAPQLRPQSSATGTTSEDTSQYPSETISSKRRATRSITRLQTQNAVNVLESGRSAATELERSQDGAKAEKHHTISQDSADIRPSGHFSSMSSMSEDMGEICPEELFAENAET